MAQLVVVPGLQAQNTLVDANVLTRITAPIHLRCVDIALIGSLLLLGITPLWLRSRIAITAALLSVAGTAALRFVALPEVYTAWSSVDRVAMAPYGRLVRAEGLAEEAYWLGLGTLAALLVMAAIVGWQWATPVWPRPAKRETPTLPDEATTTHDDDVANAA